jgi:transposase
MLCHRNEYQIRRRLDWLGKNIIITSRTAWSIEEIVQASLDRYIVEEAFRKAKDDRLVSVSPIRHWTDSKMRCHILSCIMAEVYLRLIEMKLADAGLRHTAAVVMRSMHELHSSLCWVRGQKAPQRLVEEPDAQQSSILAAFGYQVTEGKMLPLGECSPADGDQPQKRGRPNGAKNKEFVKASLPKRRGRPPKHLLGLTASKNEL